MAGRLRTSNEIERRLKRALEPILQRHAGDIRRRDLRELFDKCADHGLEREAEKRRQTVGAMFRWALSQDIVEIDPSAGLKAYDPGTPRDRVLTIEGLRVAQADRVHAFDLRVIEIVRHFLQASSAPLRPKNLDAAAFVVVQAVRATMLACLLERPPGLDEPPAS